MKNIIYWVCIFGVFTSCHSTEVEPPEPTDNATLIAGTYSIKSVHYFSTDITKFYTGSLYIDRITADSVKATYQLHWSAGPPTFAIQDQSFVETISLERKPDKSLITRGHPLSGSLLGGTFGQYKDGELALSTIDASLHLTFEK